MKQRKILLTPSPVKVLGFRGEYVGKHDARSRAFLRAFCDFYKKGRVLRSCPSVAKRNSWHLDAVKLRTHCRHRKQTASLFGQVVNLVPPRCAVGKVIPMTLSIHFRFGFVKVSAVRYGSEP